MQKRRSEIEGDGVEEKEIYTGEVETSEIEERITLKSEQIIPIFHNL